jgi:hypothetical protein
MPSSTAPNYQSCFGERVQSYKAMVWYTDGQSGRRGRLSPVLPHHRTYRSVYGGSTELTRRKPIRQA